MKSISTREITQLLLKLGIQLRQHLEVITKILSNVMYQHNHHVNGTQDAECNPFMILQAKTLRILPFLELTSHLEL